MRLDLPDAGNAVRKWQQLPDSLAPRGLSRLQAAAYVGVSVTTFDRMVKDRLMPGPMRIYSRNVWDRRKVDAAIDALDVGDDMDDAWGKMTL
jgi:predicted DNA-binding transcriptional regulator AlpA